IDGVSYVGVIAALLAMRMTPAGPAAARPGARQQFVEGFTYAFGFRPIRSIILLLALVSLVGVPYSVLMPVFAASVFHGGPHTLGILMTSSGCGALLGALWLAGRRSVIGLGRVIPRATVLFGVGLIAFAFTHVLWQSRADRLRLYARTLARDSLPRRCGLWIHGADGLEQYRHTDDRGRREAGTRDELLHDGLPGHGAIRQ